MLRSILVIVLAFFTNQACGQRWFDVKIKIGDGTQNPPQRLSVKLLKDGKIAVKDFRGLRKYETPECDTTELNAWNDGKINDAKKTIRQHVSAALATLQDPKNSEIDFLKELWDPISVATIVSDLTLINNQLSQDKKKYAVSSGIVFYKELDSLIASLDAGGKYYKVDTSRSLSGYNFSVTRYDPYYDLLVRYYNIIMKKPYNQVVARNKTIRDMNDMLKEARITKDTCERYLNKNRSEPDLPALRSIYDFAVSPRQTNLEDYMRAQWLRQWLWFTVGKINTMPLGFTDDHQLRVLPDVNRENADRFEAFVKKTDSMFVGTDSLIDVMIYKKRVLDYYKKGAGNFSDSTNYNDKIADNKKQREKFLDYNEYIANVSIPYIDGGRLSSYLFYSPADASSFGKVEKLDPLTFDDGVTVTVLNIKDNGKAALVLKSSEEIKDEAPVAGEIGTALGPLKDALTSLAGQQGLLNNFLNELNRKPDDRVIPLKRPPVNIIHDTILVKQNYNIRDELAISRHETQNGRKLNSDEIADAVKQTATFHQQLLIRYSAYFPKVASKIQNIPFDTAHVKTALTQSRMGLDGGIAFAMAEYESFLLKGAVAGIVFRYSDSVIIKRARVLSGSIDQMLLQSAPIAELKPKEKIVPAYHSEIVTAEQVEKARDVKYEVATITVSDTKKDTTKLGIFTFRTGKRHFIQASAGLTYSFSPIMVNKVNADNGTVTVTSAKEQYGVAAMLHFYPLSGGVFLQDKSFCGHNWTNIKGRMNITAGIDFRKVPDNVYLGVGYDFGPGIRLSAGCHFYKYTQYEVRNNQIADQGIIYKTSFPFIYLGIDPLALVNALNIF